MKRTYILFLCFSIPFILLSQQPIQVTGTVTSSEDGAPVPGVTVVLKGTNTGTVTDSEGNYLINVASNDTLVFSSVGLATTEMPVAGRNTLSVTMQADVIGLEEVVVTALGISREKKRLGYSLTEVQSDEINRGSSTNLSNALSGKVAGVQVSGGTGQPGGSANVVLRGYATIARETQPLYVIDGVQVTNMDQNLNTNGIDVNRTVDFGNGINDINPQDIESVSILRGSAATALYGSAGANGVIMITTKRGSAAVKGGKPLISINSSTTFSDVLRYPSYQSTFGQGWDGHFASEENGSWGPRFTNDSRLWGNEVNGRQLYKNFSFLEDQLRDFYVTGNTFDNTIAISGAGEQSTYYISYNNVYNEGVVPGDKDKYTKNSFRLNASRQMGFINISANVNYVNRETNTIPTGQGQGGMSNLFDDLLSHPTDISLVDMENYQDPNSYFNPNNYFSPYLWNPYFSINNTSNVANIDRVVGNAALDIDIFKAYRVKSTIRFGGDVSNTFGHNYDAKFTLDDNSVNKGQQDDIEGYYREFQWNVRQYTLDFLLSGGLDIADGDLQFDLTLGYNQFHRYRNYSMDEVKGLVLEQSFPNLANTTATPNVTAGFPEELWRRQGLNAILEVGFKNYLYLTGSARNTWSSALPKGNNSYFYPSVSLSFIVSDAINALKSGAGVDMLKIRAAYGQAGNDAPPYVIYPGYVEGQVLAGIPFSDLTFPLNNVRGYEYDNALGNLDLQPEISTDYEFGIDLSVFNYRMGLEATYYDRNTKGLILPRTVASSSGFTSIWDNIGEIRNYGVELGLNLVPVKLRNGIEWSLNYNFSKNFNEVVDLTEGLDEILITGFTSPYIAAIKGKTVSHVKAYGTKYTEDGRVIVDPNTGRPLPTDQNVDLGSTLHDYTMGLTNTISFRNFISLSFQFDYRHGGQFISFSKQSVNWSGKDPITTYNDRLPFVVPNSVYIDEEGNYQENTIPITTLDLNNYYAGDWNDKAIVLDKTYLKLRELSLTVELPQKWIKGAFMTRAAVSLVGNNLWLLTPAENNIVDPEISTTSNGSETEFGEIRGYPSLRTYGFRINLDF